MVDRRQKKRMTRDESLRLSPYICGPSKPNSTLFKTVSVVLKSCSQSQAAFPCPDKGKENPYPRILELIEHHTVKMFQYRFDVLSCLGTGSTPLSSTLPILKSFCNFSYAFCARPSPRDSFESVNTPTSVCSCPGVLRAASEGLPGAPCSKSVVMILVL